MGNNSEYITWKNFLEYFHTVTDYKLSVYDYTTQKHFDPNKDGKISREEYKGSAYYKKAVEKGFPKSFDVLKAKIDPTTNQKAEAAAAEQKEAQAVVQAAVAAEAVAAEKAAAAAAVATATAVAARAANDSEYITFKKFLTYFHLVTGYTLPVHDFITKLNFDPNRDDRVSRGEYRGSGYYNKAVAKGFPESFDVLKAKIDPTANQKAEAAAAEQKEAQAVVQAAVAAEAVAAKKAAAAAAVAAADARAAAADARAAAAQGTFGSLFGTFTAVTDNLKDIWTHANNEFFFALAIIILGVIAVNLFNQFGNYSNMLTRKEEGLFDKLKKKVRGLFD